MSQVCYGHFDFFATPVTLLLSLSLHPCDIDGLDHDLLTP
jgi:hypothetical protein